MTAPDFAIVATRLLLRIRHMMGAPIGCPANDNFPGWAA